MRAAFMRGDDESAVHDDATWLLDFYDTFKDCLGKDVLDLALTSLANVEGRFGKRSPTLATRLCNHLAQCISEGEVRVLGYYGWPA